MSLLNGWRESFLLFRLTVQRECAALLRLRSMSRWLLLNDSRSVRLLLLLLLLSRCSVFVRVVVSIICYCTSHAELLGLARLLIESRGVVTILSLLRLISTHGIRTRRFLVLMIIILPWCFIGRSWGSG